MMPNEAGCNVVGGVVALSQQQPQNKMAAAAVPRLLVVGGNGYLGTWAANDKADARFGGMQGRGRERLGRVVDVVSRPRPLSS